MHPRAEDVLLVTDHGVGIDREGLHLRMGRVYPHGFGHLDASLAREPDVQVVEVGLLVFNLRERVVSVLGNRLYTIYSPPENQDRVVRLTKAEVEVILGEHYG